MTSQPLRTVLQHLRRTTAAHDRAPVADADLLERFALRGDEAAFEALVVRHGPLVFNVCRRLVRHEQDAEDCFQNTFLALARSAGSIGRRQAVAGWLHRVAFRTALRSRANAVGRAARQQSLTDYPAGDASEEVTWRELRSVLDEEVSRLPAKYRLPVVLCYLAGKTTEEAARQIGCPRGTVLSRLAWARERLRARLTRRGLAVTPAVLAALPVRGSAIPPARLIGATVTAARWFTAGKAAAAGSGSTFYLMEGALRVMSLVQTKTLTVVLATALIGVGVSLWSLRPATAEAPGPAVSADAGAPSQPATSRRSNPGSACLALHTEEKLGDAPPQDAVAREAPEPALLYVNSRRIRLNYELKGMDRSEIDALYLWSTTDGGRTWQTLHEYVKHPRSLVLEVPGEGRYGFTLRARCGDDFGRPSPRAGDRPQITVEVDLTKPRLTLYAPEVGRGKEAGTLVLKWEATDKNFGPRPISLYYRDQADGPWITITEGLRNTGHHAWQIPPGLPRRVWLRITARDLAGNVADARTETAIRLGGNEPEVLIRGVEPADAKSPEDNLDGRVERGPVDGLIVLSVGRDDGVENGEILEVYRLQPQPRYLGRVKVKEVTATQSVAEPVSRQSDIRPGDRVARRIVQKK
jgi:RNA polymerase sigma factor (sigma-70 family)